MFRLENAQAPENIQRVIACLVEWLAGAENASLRRAFVVWLKRVLLPARVPGVEIPNFSELEELHDMLAERVKTWTQEWKDQGRQEGETKLLRRQLTRRFGPCRHGLRSASVKPARPSLRSGVIACWSAGA